MVIIIIFIFQLNYSLTNTHKTKNRQIEEETTLPISEHHSQRQTFVQRKKKETVH